MEDGRIVELFWARSEDAVPALSDKYGGYLRKIAENILGSPGDAEECVNDAYMRAWSAIPPERPGVLSAFMGRVTRNLAINRLNARASGKRGGGELALALEELSEVIPAGDDVELTVHRRELLEAVNGFLGTLPKRDRRAFVLRYWYAESVSAIAKRLGISENSVSVTLHRTRKKLREYLTERGFEV